MATSTIKSEVIRAKSLLSWGDYSGSTTGVDITLTRDLVPGAILLFKFGAQGRYQFFCQCPSVFGDNDIIHFERGGHYYQIKFPAVNKITFITDTSDNLKIAYQFQTLLL